MSTRHFSELLRMVLFVLDDGVAHLDTYVEFPGKEALQTSCLFALQASIQEIWFGDAEPNTCLRLAVEEPCPNRALLSLSHLLRHNRKADSRALLCNGNGGKI